MCIRDRSSISVTHISGITVAGHNKIKTKSALHYSIIILQENKMLKLWMKVKRCNEHRGEVKYLSANKLKSLYYEENSISVTVRILPII